MHVKRLHRDERGGVVVLAAVLIPMLLVLAGMLVDVGNWYTHKRQLQNRADAGALAAGLELANNWPACTTDTAKQNLITAAAKRFAGDVVNDPTSVNTEIASRQRFNVVVNSSSTNYDVGTDHTDGASGPCQVHPATPGAENETNITPLGGTWVDVKVKEVNTEGLFGFFGVDLLRNRARARVELLETSQTNEFIPIAIPEQSVAKARVRFINTCNGSELASAVLKPLEAAYQSVSGVSLWGPDPTASVANPNGTATTVTPGAVPIAAPSTVPVPNTPAASTCGDSFLDHTPIRVELRLAGRLDIDLTNAVTCAALQAMVSADCYSEISRMRVYQPTGGLFGDRPQIRDVTFSPSGAGPCTMDAYYSRSTATPSCTFDATVFMDWGGRPTANATFEATIAVDGSASRTLAGPTPQGNWTAAQVPIASLGPDWVRVSWRYELTSGGWGPGGLSGCNNKKSNPCVQTGTTTVHAVNLGNEPGGADSPSDVVAAVKLTLGGSVTSGELHSGETNATLGPHVAVGLRTAFQTGDWSVLRLDKGAGGNYSIICDPYWPQPSSVDAEAAFYFGCQPPYAKNDTTAATNFWWDAGTKQCPISKDWWKNNPPSGTWPNQTYVNAPWKCVLIDTGGNGQTTGDGIALATGNCTASKVDADPVPGPGANAKCKSSSYTCYNPPTYFGTGPPPAASDPRLVKLFVVPWNAYKFAGPKDVVPVMRLAGFYITSWRFNSREDPCFNLNAQTQAEYARLGLTGDKLSGYFVKEVETSGVGNPAKQCDAASIELCTVVMSR